MLVVVPCGGLGTRLGYEGQKCLAPCAGRPFLHWRLDQLVEAGATQFVLLIGYNAESTWISIADHWAGKTPVEFLTDPEQRHPRGEHGMPAPGPWGSVEKAAKLIRDETFWVCFGDVWHPAPLLDDLDPGTMYVTGDSPTEAFNLPGGLLDIGTYKVSKADPAPTDWTSYEVKGRTWTINTPEQWKETDAHLEKVAAGTPHPHQSLWARVVHRANR